MEKSLLRFLKRFVLSIQTEKQMRTAFSELRNEILPYSTDKFQTRALDYFDILAWLESKIEGRSFSEVLKQKSLLKP